jgi:hypothetical protein
MKTKRQGPRDFKSSGAGLRACREMFLGRCQTDLQGSDEEMCQCAGFG